MRKSADRLEETSPLAGLLSQGVAAAGTAISRNPLMVGGTTAFLVTLFYVSANALWYQPQVHSGAFFVTRELPAFAAPTFDEEAHEIDDAPTVPVRKPDPTVERVQGLLIDLKLYTGSIDGLTGPQTRKAVEDYQRMAGLDVSGQIDQRLLDDISKRRAPRTILPDNPVGPETVAEPSRDVIVKVQAGLKAFGNDGIEVDGALGSKTRTAIKAFQSLFGLPVTGEVDAPLVAKMQEIGLTN